MRLARWWTFDPMVYLFRDCYDHAHSLQSLVTPVRSTCPDISETLVQAGFMLHHVAWRKNNQPATEKHHHTGSLVATFVLLIICLGDMLWFILLHTGLVKTTLITAFNMWCQGKKKRSKHFWPSLCKKGRSVADSAAAKLVSQDFGPQKHSFRSHRKHRKLCIFVSPKRKGKQAFLRPLNPITIPIEVIKLLAPSEFRPPMDEAAYDYAPSPEWSLGPGCFDKCLIWDERSKL